MPILGYPTSVQMGLISEKKENFEVAAITVGSYPDVFDGGLGQLPGTQHIRIVQTYKDNGDLRVCIDPHELNKVILRQHYTLLVLEDILLRLREAKILRKADLTRGF